MNCIFEFISRNFYAILYRGMGEGGPLPIIPLSPPWRHASPNQENPECPHKSLPPPSDFPFLFTIFSQIERIFPFLDASASQKVQNSQTHRHLALYAFVWLCMTMYDYVWLCMILYNNVLQCIAMYDNIWLCMTMYD